MSGPPPGAAIPAPIVDDVQLTCTRCGATYYHLHACEHPQHAAIDPDCIYYTPPAFAVTGAAHQCCDICRPIRALLTDALGSA